MSRMFYRFLAILTPLLLWSQFCSAAIQWIEDYNAALKQSKETHKPILMLFTGSDWCGWCKKLEKEVFDTKEFEDKAGDTFIFLKLDFPMRESQSQAIKDQNAKLKTTYGVTGFPTVVLLDENGQKIASTGYKPGGGLKYAEYLLKTLSDYQQYQKKTASAELNQLSPGELESLFNQAKTFGLAKDQAKIIALGSKSSAPGFFLKERYLDLAEQGKLGGEEALVIKKKLLASNDANLQDNARRIAIIEFQSLAGQMEVSHLDPWTVCKPLLDYIAKYGKNDRENLWRLQMTVAQTLLNAHLLDDALTYAHESYESAPPAMKETVAEAIKQIEKLKHAQACSTPTKNPSKN